MPCALCRMDTDQFKKARGYVLRLFKLRPRSTGELKKKLQMKGYEGEIIEKIISECAMSGLLDDSAFAKAWLQSRLKKYGFRRVSRELAEKGITKELIDTVWQDAREDYDEEALVRQIAERRFFSREQKDIPLLKRKKHVMDYLARRGFNLGIINKVIRQL